ncbi:MAG: hypothetical protein ACOY3Y_08220 [Acidobacteriota bacterium]
MTTPDTAGGRWTRERLARTYVWLVALHTLAVGCALFLVPDWALRFGGWQVIPSPFFPRQAGIFHFILGIAYLGEMTRHRDVSLMVMAKTFAVVFLLGAWFADGVPWFVPLAGVGDGAMAAGALVARPWLRSARG